MGKPTNKKEMLVAIFREFHATGILDADNLRRALAELDQSSESEIDTMCEIVIFTRDNQ